jgi:F-type H+-transporting ATPase subunit epsilon
VADTFEIEIATPERLLAREKAVRAQIPAKEGYIGVLPDHASLLSELGIGAMTYTTPGDQLLQRDGDSRRISGDPQQSWSAC